MTYVDSFGRKWATQIPDHAPESEAEFGIPLGPPPLDGLNLPEEIQTRLHNQLFERGLFNNVNVSRRRTDLQAAIQYAVQLHQQRLVDLYSAPVNAPVGVNGHAH